MKTTLIALASALFLGATCTHAAEKPKSYPKDTCIVSDNKLGSMGRIITKTHEGQEVKFCCKPCIRKFDKDPQKYLKKLSKK
jgi:hypothetical protein